MPRISKAHLAKGIEYVLKTLVLVLALYYLGSRLLDDRETFLWITDAQIHGIGIIVPFIIGLCIVNWGLEAGKWFVISKQLGETSYADCFRGVMSGLTLSMFIPAGIGDYLGRLGYLKTDRKLEAAALVYLTGIVQFMVTLVFGLFGLFYVLRQTLPINGFELLGFMLLAVSVVAIGLCSLAHLGVRWSRGLRGHFLKINNALRAISRWDLRWLISLAILRYLVFGLQLYLLLDVFKPEVGMPIILAGITWIFLSKTILPTFNFLSDLGVREFSAVFFFSLFGIGAHLIVIPTLVLWLVNIFLPSLLGLYFILTVRIFRPQYI